MGIGLMVWMCFRSPWDSPYCWVTQWSAVDCSRIEQILLQLCGKWIKSLLFQITNTYYCIATSGIYFCRCSSSAICPGYQISPSGMSVNYPKYCDIVFWKTHCCWLNVEKIISPQCSICSCSDTFEHITQSSSTDWVCSNCNFLLSTLGFHIHVALAAEVQSSSLTLETPSARGIPRGGGIQLLAPPMCCV